jgi:hypothetical protein
MNPQSSSTSIHFHAARSRFHFSTLKLGEYHAQALRMLITTPAIAKLFLRPRLWAYRQAKAGRFGPVIRRRGRAFYVPLRNVAAYRGSAFSADQLAALGLTRTEEVC